MKPIYVKIIYDRRGQASNSRNIEGKIEIRLSQNRQSKYFATGISLLPKHWHHGQVVGRPDAPELQKNLDIIMRRTRDIINIMMDEGCCSMGDVLTKLREAEKAEMSFLEFCEIRASVRTYGKSPDSKERYERFLKYLLSFGKFEKFADVTDENIMSMDKDLQSKGMKNYSKWQNYHRFLNSFILDAIDAGYLTRNPYRWLHIEKDKSSGGIGKYLTKEEFFAIRNLHPSTDSLCRVRDLFVFQTYTCLSYTDLAAFDASLIQYVNGKPIYTSHRGKTNQEFKFLVLPPAMDILKKYNNHLPVISNEKYNDYLKIVALEAKIKKPISSHWARHTGATMLLNSGHLDMEIVAKVLGHSSTKITRQVYAKLLDNTVVDAMSKIEL